MATKPEKKQRKLRSKFTARLTSKYQATIPKQIRDHLHFHSGDIVIYEVLPNNTVILKKTTPLDLDDLQALNSTLNKWESEEDEQAYKNL